MHCSMPQQQQQQRLQQLAQPRFWVTSPILQAFGKAVAIWMLVYLVTVHLYVAWKWDSHAGMEATTTTTTTTTSILMNDTAILSSEVEEDSRLLENAAAAAAQLERLEQLTTKLHDEIARTKELTRQVQEVTLQMQQANDNAKTTKTSSKQPPKDAASINKLLFAAQQHTNAEHQTNIHRPLHLQEFWNLLHRNKNNNKDASNPQDSAAAAMPPTAAAAALQDQATFRQMVRLANNDLVRNIQLQHDVDWAALKVAFDNILSSSTNDDDVALVENNSVSQVDDDDNNNNNSCSPNTATEEDLEDHVEQIRNILKARREGHYAVLQERDAAADDTNDEKLIPLPVLFPQTLERLKQFLEEQKRVKLQQGAAAAKEQATTTTGAGTQQDCMQSQNVVPWLEAGLDAIYRRKDLRQAILYAIEESSSSVSGADGIILDAELNQSNRPGTTNKKTSGSGTNRSRSLRQVIDGPFLSDSMVRFINLVLDSVSGYNDRFDQFIDRLAAQNENSNIGHVIGTRLLKACGRLTLPDTV